MFQTETAPAARKAYEAPRFETCDDYPNMGVEGWREVVMTDDGAWQQLAARWLAERGLAQCETCNDDRWGYFSPSSYALDYYGQRASIDSDGYSPCPCCNEEGEASEGEPVCSLPFAPAAPATMPAVTRVAVTA